jgi:hypothetical protein
VKGDARKELRPAVVRWYDAQVAQIGKAQIAAPTAQEIADVLPHWQGDYQLLVMICVRHHGRPESDTYQAGYFKVGNKV